jgi:branched-chain amino acid transport system permease protein
MLIQWMFALFNGLAMGMSGFLVAAGLTLVFGILKILNFAHGSFFMIGAYVTFTLIGRDPSSIGMLVGASLVGGAVVAVLGLITDTIVFRRIRDADVHYTLIATFALLLVCDGLTKAIWGLDFYSINPPPELDSTLRIGGVMIPAYSLFVIACGVVIFFLLDLAIHRMWIGKIVQAVARDSWMTGVLGVNVPVTMTVSVVASFLLAGLSGGLLIANQSLSPELGGTYLLLAFNAVIIGGLGNIRGAFIASVLLGLVESVSTIVLPNLPGLSIYLALIIFLIVKPNGLFNMEVHA